MMDQYKIALINKNGQIEKIGETMDEMQLHSVCLLEFALKNYPDVPIFKKLTNRHTPEIISYFYTLLGNIVFLNTTKDEKKYGKTGFFMFPNGITENQQVSIFAFAQSIKDFSTTIFYDLKLVDGMIEEKALSSMDYQYPEELLKSYFEKGKERRL